MGPRRQSDKVYQLIIKIGVYLDSVPGAGFGLLARPRPPPMGRNPQFTVGAYTDCVLIQNKGVMRM